MLISILETNTKRKVSQYFGERFDEQLILKIHIVHINI